jgi:NADPH:quinone reductase-like Zn-dependent oxidoreductase
VAVLPWLSCGQCESCARGSSETCQNSSIFGWERDGGYAELFLAPASNVLPLPAGLDPSLAAAIVLSATTALHMLDTVGKLQPGETVLVLAAGSGLGAYAVQIAKHFDANVLATAGSDEKLAKTERLGAIAIDHRDPQFSKEVRRHTGGRGVDLVVEHVGPATWQQSLDSLATGGRIVTAGATTGAKVELDLLRLYARQVSIHGALRGRPEELARILQLAAAGEIAPVVDRVLPIAEASDAHRALENREVFGKILLVP